jgi:hypothetical protein
MYVSMADENAYLLILTLRCDRASALASESYDRELSRSERIALTLHRLICGPCRRLRRQLATLHQAMVRLADEVDPTTPPILPALPESVRARIARALDDESRQA